MKIKREMILREIAGEKILVPGAESVLDLNRLFVMTDTGAFIWSVLAESENVDEITDKMLEEYEVDRETAKADIKEFLERLRSYGIVD